MRTHMDIDDALMAAAMEATGAPTKKAAVETAPCELVRRHWQVQAIEGMIGLGWEGDLDQMRRDWHANPG